MSRDIARQPQAQLQANVKPAFVPRSPRGGERATRGSSARASACTLHSAILQEQCPFYELTAITFAWVIKNDKDRLADSDVGYACKVLGHKDGEVSLTFAEMESLIRQRRLSRHSLLVHLRTFLGSEIFYSSCDEEDAILKDIVAAQIAIISASLYTGSDPDLSGEDDTA